MQVLVGFGKFRFRFRFRIGPDRNRYETSETYWFRPKPQSMGKTKVRGFGRNGTFRPVSYRFRSTPVRNKGLVIGFGRSRLDLASFEQYKGSFASFERNWAKRT
jgi:hypothetical protein